MSVTDLGERWFRWYRRTDWMLEATQISASMTPSVDKCPQNDGFVELRVRGDNPAGTVELVGEVDGVPTTEMLTFAGVNDADNRKMSCTDGLCVTSMNTTGFGANTTLEAKYVSSSGTSIPINCIIEDCVQAYGERSGMSTWPNRTAGSKEDGKGFIAFDDVFDDRPRPGDVFVELDEDGNEGDKWLVVGRPEHLGVMRRHHWELDVKLMQAADTTIRPAP